MAICESRIWLCPSCHLTYENKEMYYFKKLLKLITSANCHVFCLLSSTSIVYWVGIFVQVHFSWWYGTHYSSEQTPFRRYACSTITSCKSCLCAVLNSKRLTCLPWYKLANLKIDFARLHFWFRGPKGDMKGKRVCSVDSQRSRWLPIGLPQICFMWYVCVFWIIKLPRFWLKASNRSCHMVITFHF